MIANKLQDDYVQTIRMVKNESKYKIYPNVYLYLCTKNLANKLNRLNI